MSQSNDDSGILELDTTPRKKGPTREEKVKLDGLEVEINKELDDSYGTISVETNRRQHAYPPVFDKLGQLVAGLKKLNYELEEKNLGLHRELELQASRLKNMDEVLVKKVSEAVTKGVKQDIELKITWMANQVLDQEERTNTLMKGLVDTFENSINSMKKEISEAVELMLESQVDQEYQPQINQAQHHHLQQSGEPDLRDKITNKRSTTPIFQQNSKTPRVQEEYMQYSNTPVVTVQKTSLLQYDHQEVRTQMQACAATTPSRQSDWELQHKLMAMSTEQNAAMQGERQGNLVKMKQGFAGQYQVIMFFINFQLLITCTT